jgi:ElaB/YqjD/DUF883 family membrane-anchored ribosome-binding protein
MNTKGTNTNDVGSVLTRGVDQAVATARDKIDSLSDAAKPTVDRITSGAHDVADQVSSAATQAAKQLRVSSKKLQKMEKRLAKDARGYVRQHPLASLGIALAAGYVVSRVLSSRSASSSEQ